MAGTVHVDRRDGGVGVGAVAECDSVSLRVPFQAPSAALARRELHKWMRAQGLEGDTVDDARVVISELVGNSVRHAAPIRNNDIIISWSLESQGLLLSVSDGGSGTSPHAVHSPMSAVSGRGLSIVDALSERWWVEDAFGQTTVFVLMAV